jgi:hypothetical protein
MKQIADPNVALKAVGTENSQLHEELATVYAEVDLYRDALFAIAGLGEEKLPADVRFDKAMVFADKALRQERMPEWQGVRRRPMTQRSN